MPFRFAIAVMVSLAAIVAAAPVCAEDKPKTADVVVKSKRKMNRIDRQVYDLPADAPAGESTEDALQKIPDVAVDPNGGVTVRGKSVDILINGKPSALMAGDNRAAALRAMPSKMVASIEVMSSPGAQFGGSGAGGIINIVTKRAMDPGSLLSATVKLYTNGDVGADAFLQRNKGRFATTASLNVSTERRPMDSRFSHSDLSATPRATINSHATDSENRTLFGNASVEYDAGPFDTLTGQVAIMDLSGTSQTSGATALSLGGVETDRYTTDDMSRSSHQTTTAGLTWTHAGKDLGEALKVSATLARTMSRYDSAATTTYLLSRLPQNTGVLHQDSASDTDGTALSLGVDYNAFIGDDQITAGAQIDHSDVARDTLVSGLYAPGLNPLLTTAFAYRQTLSAAYATWQKALGNRWVVLGGLRVEALDFQSPGALPAHDVRISQTHINPSLFATYVIAEDRKLRFTYARRLDRPGPDDLNPALSYFDALTVRRGTPRLRPQEIDSVEAAYERETFGKSWSVRLYGNRTHGVINPVRTFVDDPQGAGNQVVEITRRNAGHNLQTGVQLTFNLMFGETWSLNGNADLYAQSMDAPDTGHRTLRAMSGQAGLSYMAKASHVSVNYNYFGKQLMGDGYMDGSGSASVFYSRKLSPSLRLVAGATGLFQTRDRSVVRNVGPVRGIGVVQSPPARFSIGLSKSLGTGVYRMAQSY